VRLLGEPRDVGVARAFLRRVLEAHEERGNADSALAVLSEIVANAVVHGRGPVDVRVRMEEGAVELQVADTEPTLPTQREPADDAEGGRGIAIVDALSHWWVEATERGKVVHARVPLR